MLKKIDITRSLLRKCGIAEFRLYSLDASTIDLCLGVFPWADFRKKKGAMKLHVGLNHAGYLPKLVIITDGKVHDVTVGRTLKFPPGSIVAIDKGYNDYAWCNRLTDKVIFFVIRLKTNARYRTVERRTVLKDKGLSSDQTIEFTGAQTAKNAQFNYDGLAIPIQIPENTMLGLTH